MRVVHEAIQDRVSERVFTNAVVPLIGRQLTDDDRCVYNNPNSTRATNGDRSVLLFYEFVLRPRVNLVISCSRSLGLSPLRHSDCSPSDAG